MDKLSLWNEVSKTNPADTKTVNQRGGFTAIDAYSQIKAATKTFGPVGRGWGWTVESALADTPAAGCYTVMIKFWYIDADLDVRCAFNTFGAAKSERDPDECAKKALTDAITKALSYLGFNADVFTGKFDDSKYVEKRRQEVKGEDKEAAMRKWVEGFLAETKYFTPEERIALMDKHEKAIERLTKDYRDLLITGINTQNQMGAKQ